MSLVLLADDSPHALRMGERILREEGFAVVSITDGDEVLRRLPELDPDVILADVFLAGRSGIDICRTVKSLDRLRHIRVVLTAGMLEPFDEAEGLLAGCDGILKKPFEASALVETITPLIEASRYARGLFGETVAAPVPGAAAIPAGPSAGGPRENPDPERVRAAITIALDRALPAMIEEITERVLVALGH